jgi:hypothetical protein
MQFKLAPPREKLSQIADTVLKILTGALRDLDVESINQLALDNRRIYFATELLARTSEFTREVTPVAKVAMKRT